MTTALSLYGLDAASADLSTAAGAESATGAAGNNLVTSLIGTATGYGELYSLGNAGAWSAAGSLPGPSGNGFLFDSTVLEGQTITGTWTPVFRFGTSGTPTIVADLYIRAYKWNGSTYTLIGNMLLSAQTLNSTITAYTWAGTTLTASFVTGEKLYYQVNPNVTSNTGSTGTTTLKMGVANSATLGRAANAELDTPGYSPTAASHSRVFDGLGGFFR